MKLRTEPRNVRPARNGAGFRVFRAIPVLLCCFLLQCLGCHARSTADTPPILAEVQHSPQQPRHGDTVVVTANLKEPAESVSLEYQIVEPGDYIALNDSRYKSDWTPLPMSRVDTAVWHASVPAEVQQNRCLIRCRLKVKEPGGATKIAPAQDGPEPNFAWFVYDGVPAWRAAIRPGGSDPRLSQSAEFSAAVMNQVQSYFLIGKQRDIENATWYRQSFGKDYPYTGTLVANGEVYDHVHFRARGGVWRYAMGKNMWKIDFNKGHRFEARDDYGQPYQPKWSKLNLRACIQQGDYGRRGEQGMYEAVGFRLFNLAGVDAPRTQWVSLRIVDQREENPADQYQGDFWGLYLAIENEDGRFLKGHGLPDGNLYKMMDFRGELSNHGEGQVQDNSDINDFLGRIQRRETDSWWRTNVDLPRYYSYRSIVEAIHHYDISGGKNYDFYRNPGSGKWCVVPWDIDLSWGDHMYGQGYEPFTHPVLSRPEFHRAYQNRLREIRDLLFNPDEAGRLIDECAAIISRPNAAPSIVDADRAKWDYHPIMSSRYSMHGKAGQGLFYRASKTRDFAGMVRQMKEYVEHRARYIDSTLINDPEIPETPAIRCSGPAGFSANALAFRSSEYRGKHPFAAIQWRIGAVEPAASHRPGQYEITAVWESGPLNSAEQPVAIPAGTLKPATTYRARARFQDQTGRCGHWSAPIEFKASN